VATAELLIINELVRSTAMLTSSGKLNLAQNNICKPEGQAKEDSGESFTVVEGPQWRDLARGKAMVCGYALSVVPIRCQV